jgi:hypothetical protein
MRRKKPIVLLQLQEPSKPFNFDDAFALLGDLQTKLPELSPTAVVELRTHTQQPLIEIQETVREALEMARARGVPHLNVNG